ncbi:MAG: hypothetical protein JWP97_5321 [Labilithrix sp.]|nr:hypothetical protein [Labilithrix sp.]
MSASEQLAGLEHGTSDAEATAFFDSLPAVPLDTMIGRWRGSEIDTGHPMNGLLAPSGWYGKEFLDLERVHPLLFQTPGGDIFPVDPRKVPISVAPLVPRALAPLARRALPVLRAGLGTTEPRARLRTMELRGKTSATMIYDHLPIQDSFRAVDDRTLLGAMDRRGDERLFFFILRRAT